MTQLDAAIAAALAGTTPSQRGVHDFAGSPSAVKKAENVIAETKNSGIDLATAAVISLGGADGTEIEHILRNTSITKGVVIEFDDDLAQRAISKITALSTEGKELRVLTGDVSQKLSAALKLLHKWHDERSVESVIVTIHALLHELPNRGGKTTDVEALLARFLEPKLPGKMIIREPCAPRDLPEIVYLRADCQPANLATLADRIRRAHPEVFKEPEPVPMYEKVRMSSRLAVETIVKVFYLDSFTYELDEVVTAFTRNELLDAVRNVFGTDNVRHADLQSDSFERFWNMYGFRLTDAQHRECARPQLHIALIATWKADENPIGPLPKPSVSRPELAQHERPSKRPRRRRAKTHTNMRSIPDVFTPGIDELAIRKVLAPLLASDQIERVVQISRESFEAVEQGDFSKQTLLGESLIEVAGDLPDFHASGLYFAAEGYRLLADVESDTTRQAEFRDIASQYYSDAIRISPETPSSYRGLGRIREIEGDLSEAMRLFEVAYGYALAGFAAGKTLPKAPALAHEILRTSRHRLHCIMGVRDSVPGSRWNQEVNVAEVRGDTEKADRYHQELMELFRSQPKWMWIEFFMAMVFLARAWGSIGNSLRAEYYFLEALHARRRLLESGRGLTAVEQSNLRWWVANVCSTENMSKSLYAQCEELSSLLTASSPAAIVEKVDEIIQPVRAATRIRPT